MNFWFLIICFGLAFVLQYILTMMQMKSFTQHYGKLRRIGRVAIGKQKGGFKSGAIAMFAIDDKGDIIQGSYLTGVTVLARFKTISGFEGKNIASLCEEDAKNYPKQVRKAVVEASSNYITIMAGGVIDESKSPLASITGSFKKVVGQK